MVVNLMQYRVIGINGRRYHAATFDDVLKLFDQIEDGIIIHLPDRTVRDLKNNIIEHIPEGNAA